MSVLQWWCLGQGKEQASDEVDVRGVAHRAMQTVRPFALRFRPAVPGASRQGRPPASLFTRAVPQIAWQGGESPRSEADPPDVRAGATPRARRCHGQPGARGEGGRRQATGARMGWTGRVQRRNYGGRAVCERRGGRAAEHHIHLPPRQCMRGGRCALRPASSAAPLAPWPAPRCTAPCRVASHPPAAPTARRAGGARRWRVQRGAGHEQGRLHGNSLS